MFYRRFRQGIYFFFDGGQQFFLAVQSEIFVYPPRHRLRDGTDGALAHKHSERRRFYFFQHSVSRDFGNRVPDVHFGKRESDFFGNVLREIGFLFLERLRRNRAFRQSADSFLRGGHYAVRQLRDGGGALLFAAKSLLNVLFRQQLLSDRLADRLCERVFSARNDAGRKGKPPLAEIFRIKGAKKHFYRYPIGDVSDRRSDEGRQNIM